MVHLHLNKHIDIAEYQRGDFLISTDIEKLNFNIIYHFLAHDSYWAQGITLEQADQRVYNAFCFGLYYQQAEQVGFARVISDFTSLAYLSDVFILPMHRGQGLGQWLVATVLAHPAFRGVPTWSLKTEDAHGLYERFGFRPLKEPKNFLLYNL